jgi:mRNA-degrading endonuclease RelE of RelBE toxin-antitoxin system
MKSSTSRRFREMYADLPEPVRTHALRAYRLFQSNPAHRGLNFKKVEGTSNVYSVRIGRGYRALGQMDSSNIVWFWIGPHSDYDRLV